MKITDAQLKQIYAHAKEAYPSECCGFMIGQLADGGLVRSIRRATNQLADHNDRFEISAEAFAAAHFAASDAGQEIVGIYHSHPDWPAIPSQTDMKNAWEDVYFLITSVHEGMPLSTAVWELIADKPRRFVPVPLEIMDQAEQEDSDE